MIGQTVSHYKVLARLGAGAMGEVYLAEDLRLGRRVALKLLAPELIRDETAKARLVREAQAASQLDHPNICAVYDIEDLAEGQLLLAMAFCDGETLKARLSRGRVPVEVAVEVACQMADALGEAHAHGIIHRDIKPANVMLTKTLRVKLVDFGIAQLPEATVITTTGAMVGTPAYMSPEQVRGEPVDARADLWALGVVLYEMLAGRPPFGGHSVQAVLYGVAHEAPEPLDRLRPGLPPPLVRIVNRALAKESRARYQQAELMLADLKECKARLDAAGPAAGTAAARVPSIAVLPFANLSADREQDYFCEGMTEELITALGAIEGLRVAARTSTFHVQGRGLDIRAIGEQLNVETILEGGVRKAGDRLRVTTQLVNVSDGYHLWSERYDRRLDDVFAVQDDIARAIADKLRVKLIGLPEAPLVRRASVNVEAYQLYLKGRYYFTRRYKGGLDQAMECFLRVIEMDPESAPALAGLADCHSLMGFYGLRPPRELLPQARQEARRAVALDDGLAEAHQALAMVHLWLDWNWEVIQREFGRALALDPNAPLAHGYWALSLAIMGESEAALREADQCTALDPLSALAFNLASAAHFNLRRYGPAIDNGQRAFSLDPDFLPASYILSLSYSETGRHEEAIEAAERGVNMTGRAPFFLSILGHALAKAGRRDAARQVIDELTGRAGQAYVPQAQVALIHGALGEVENAIVLLEQGMAQWGGAYVLPLSSPAYEPLRAHPRYVALLRELGYTDPWPGSQSG